MADIEVVVACAECRIVWPLDTDPRCADPRHHHQRHEVHRRRTRVELLDGTPVIAASFVEDGPDDREQVPGFGLYFDRRWQPPWPHAHIDWPDFGVPGGPDHFRRALHDVLSRAREGQRVEIGCIGGHGRTGTALACLAVLAGCDPAGAVAWVRSSYCPAAVEAAEQAAFVATFTA